MKARDVVYRVTLAVFVVGWIALLAITLRVWGVL